MSVERIQVHIRVRPLVPERELLARDTCVQVDGKTIHVRSESEVSRELRCAFDSVLGPESTQLQVYETVGKPCINAVQEGYNATIFAYGQTGSGKTHTMFGQDRDGNAASVVQTARHLLRVLENLTDCIIHHTQGIVSARTGHLPSFLQKKGEGWTNEGTRDVGIIPRAVREVFAGIRAAKKTRKTEVYSVYCSMMQVYNECIYDLLRDAQRTTPLYLHEDPSYGIYVEGLAEYEVKSAHECLLLLARGDDSRAVRSTVMNQMSSRSHTIFQLLIEKTKTEDGGEAVVTRSKLNLVDLAGSEKWNVHDESIAGAHVSELQNINLSLHTLARCIRALSASVHEHVPFRESKLTRILQDSLGGTARTCVIATLSPSALNFAETISTLKFADQAKQVMQYVRVHAVESVDMALVQRLREEIQKLQFSNAKLRASAGQQETHRGDSSSESPGQTYKRTAVPNAHRGAPAQTVTHNKHHQIAASVLDEVVATLNGLKGRFFEFEIEEDDFKKEFSAKIKSAIATFTAERDKAHLKPSQSQPIKAQIDNYIGNDRRVEEHTEPPLKYAKQPRKQIANKDLYEKKNVLHARRPKSTGREPIQSQGTSKDVRYRIIKTPSTRDRTNTEAFDGEWKSERKSETDLKAEIREAMARVRKQKKLKQYYEEKARREQEQTRLEQEAEEQQRREAKIREDQRRKRALRQKKKLLEYRKDIESMRESRF